MHSVCLLRLLNFQIVTTSATNPVCYGSHEAHPEGTRLRNPSSIEPTKATACSISTSPIVLSPLVVTGPLFYEAILRISAAPSFMPTSGSTNQQSSSFVQHEAALQLAADLRHCRKSNDERPPPPEPLAESNANTYIITIV